MALNQRIQGLLDRLSANVRDFNKQQQENIERIDVESTGRLNRELRAARENRMPVPSASLTLLSQLAGSSPIAAAGAGWLAGEADFANFMNKRIDDAKSNIELAAADRAETRDIVSSLAGIQSNILERQTGVVQAEADALQAQAQREADQELRDARISNLESSTAYNNSRARGLGNDLNNPEALTPDNKNNIIESAGFVLGDINERAQNQQEVTVNDIGVAVDQAVQALSVLDEQDSGAVITSGLADNIRGVVKSAQSRSSAIDSRQEGVDYAKSYFSRQRSSTLPSGQVVATESGHVTPELERESETLVQQKEAITASLATLETAIENSNLSNAVKKSLSQDIDAAVKENAESASSPAPNNPSGSRNPADSLRTDVQFDVSSDGFEPVDRIRDILPMLDTFEKFEPVLNEMVAERLESDSFEYTDMMLESRDRLVNYLLPGVESFARLQELLDTAAQQRGVSRDEVFREMLVALTADPANAPKI